MSEAPITISKIPTLTEAEDYFLLRKEGIGLIEGMSKSKWTDYNTHDPGITILEALCYAITDLAFRTGWSVKDLLADSSDQPFFSAREILTINPWTPDDFRRLLVDLDMVRNAWAICKDCACEVEVVEGSPKGLYDIFLELEAHDRFGDLNDRKVTRTFNEVVDDKLQELIVEMRFPEWNLLDKEAYRSFIGSTVQPASIVLTKVSRSKIDNNTVDASELRKHWRNVFYVTYAVTINGQLFTIPNVAVRFFGSTSVKNVTTAEIPPLTSGTFELQKLLTTVDMDGVIQVFRSKCQEVAANIASAKALLHGHRNLDEDFCSVSVVRVEDVAACGTVEVAPDADIERVQAEIWFLFEQYFNPSIPFYSLAEMQAADTPVEEVFDGPTLSNGFIRDEDLAASGLKQVLRVSDIINLIMSIEGVVAVSNLLLTKYDDEGNLIKGAADPVWSNGVPMFDADRISAAWLLYVTDKHLPRLYHSLSNFHFNKNGLPFTPRQDEVIDTLLQLRGAAERIKTRNAPNDLPIPQGTKRDLVNALPIQYSFPLVYGIGPHGLPSHASTLRRAQARQLKSYLLVFEQILGNRFAQIEHVGELFSLRPNVDRTYFHRVLTESIISGYDELTNGPSANALASMLETVPEFQDRRNGFLDHVMARFGEQFGDYALLLTNWQGQSIGAKRLIEDKISFLKAYPKISSERGKAFNYRVEPAASYNIPGIKKRVSLLLGFPDLRFVWTTTDISVSPITISDYKLVDGNETVWLEGQLGITSTTLYAAKKQAYDVVLTQLSLLSAYQIVENAGAFTPVVLRNDLTPLGRYPTPVNTRELAQAIIEELTAWASNERGIVVEHLLLRPKFPGDATFPLCGSAVVRPDCGCEACSGHDPYSFLLTFVMPGWSAPYNENMDLRGFANRTIQHQTPSHLLGKTCWVGNDGFVYDNCDPVIDDVSEVLAKEGLTIEALRPTCKQAGASATNIYQRYSSVFSAWYADKTLGYFQGDALKIALETLFGGIELTSVESEIVLGPTLSSVNTIMVKRFHDVATYGWQFERFENAWKAWLDANSAIDWMDEHLHESVEAVLDSGLIQGDASKLCACAESILATYGASFRAWMDHNIKLGRGFVDFVPFVPTSVALCDGLTFKPGTVSALNELLANRYEPYKVVSYRLWVVVHLLSNLRNTYPGATLHDCDDGSDANPVRLGSTALGNYRARATSGGLDADAVDADRSGDVVPNNDEGDVDEPADDNLSADDLKALVPEKKTKKKKPPTPDKTPKKK